MSDELYARDLLRWASDVRHSGRLEAPDAEATGSNPMCGDRCHMTFALHDGVVTEARHETRACALTQGSAAILSAHAAGETPQSLATLREAVASMLRSEGVAPDGKWAAYGLYAGAAQHKSRHVCVLLPLDAALKAFS
jgi:NifU-like protein involved in Fe-S cluster formation